MYKSPFPDIYPEHTSTPIIFSNIPDHPLSFVTYQYTHYLLYDHSYLQDICSTIGIEKIIIILYYVVLFFLNVLSPTCKQMTTTRQLVITNIF